MAHKEAPGRTTPGGETWKVLDLALRIGEVLLSSGAGAADVAAQMLNVAHACGLRGATADVTFTALTMSAQPSADEPPQTQVRQVRHRDTDYDHLTQVDHLIRALIRGELTPDAARSQLARVVSTGHGLPRWAVTLGWGVMNAGVALMLGGGWRALLIAFVAAIGIDRIQRVLARRRLPAFYQQVAGGLFATLVAVGVAALDLGIGPGRVITSSIILLLAGVSFMGAVQDALTGYPLTAGARILEALLATAGLIAGVSGGLSVAHAAGVGLGHLSPGAAALGTMPQTVVGGMVTAGAFAFASYAPKRSLLPIAAIGGVATATFFAVYAHNGAIAWASAVAAIVIGLVSFSVAGRVRVPALVVVVSAVVPMLPGLSIYRGLAMMSEGGSEGLLAMVTAAAIAISLAAGVILGEYVAQPLKREARRLESKLAGPRLVGPQRAGKARRNLWGMSEDRNPKPRRERARDPRTGRDAAAERARNQAQWVDQQVRAAIQRGDFDNLPGAGKPISGLGSTHDPDWWVKKLVERERITGVLPPALQLRKEDAELEDTLDAEYSEKAVREILVDFNRRVVEARRQLLGGPPVITKLRDVESEVEAWRDRRRRPR